jgi:hypothetical protein
MFIRITACWLADPLSGLWPIFDRFSYRAEPGTPNLLGSGKMFSGEAQNVLANNRSLG